MNCICRKFHITRSGYVEKLYMKTGIYDWNYICEKISYEVYIHT